ncbi:hypothetical protein ACQY0O_006764 [Thecaphora frezii]
MMLEPLCDKTLSWVVPFYDSLKTLFFLWLLFTRSIGSTMLFHRFVVPMVEPYEPIVDTIIHAVAGLIPGAVRLLRQLPKLKDWIATPHAPAEAPTTPPFRVQAQSEEPSIQYTRRPRQGQTRGAKPESGPGMLVPPRPDTYLAPEAPVKDVSAAWKEQPGMAAPSGSETTEFHVDGDRAHNDLDGTILRQSAAPFPSQRKATPDDSVARSTDMGKVPSPPMSLRNFAFIPSTVGRDPTSTKDTADPARLLSPPPTLPGHFNFVFVPPPLQQVALLDKAAKTSLNMSSTSDHPATQSQSQGQRSGRTKIAQPTSNRPVISPLSAPFSAKKRWSDSVNRDDRIVAPPTRRVRSNVADGASSINRPQQNQRSAQESSSEKAFHDTLPTMKAVLGTRPTSNKDRASGGGHGQGKAQAQAQAQARARARARAVAAAAEANVPFDAGTAAPTKKRVVSLAGAKRRLEEDDEAQEELRPTRNAAKSGPTQTCEIAPSPRKKMRSALARVPTTAITRPGADTTSAAEDDAASQARRSAKTSATHSVKAPRATAAATRTTRITRSRANAAKAK